MLRYALYLYPAKSIFYLFLKNLLPYLLYKLIIQHKWHHDEGELGCIQLPGDRFHMNTNTSAAPLTFCNVFVFVPNTFYLYN